MIRLYMDENVHGDITTGVRTRGVDVLTVQEDGREGLLDSLVLDRARELSRVLFTHDDDFLGIAALRQAAYDAFAGVIYVHQRATTVGECIRDLEYLAKAGEPHDFSDRVLHIPL